MKKRIFLGSMVMFLCFSLAGCKSSDYKKALSLEEAGDYSSALAIYEKISDYKDSADHIATSKEMIAAIEEYEKAKAIVQQRNVSLDIEISKAEDIISKGEKPLDDELIPSLETAVSKAKAVKVTVPEMPATGDEIYKVIDELNDVNYDEVLENLYVQRDSLETSIKQYSLVNAPSEAYIIQSLSNVPNIVDISAVTEDNDPNRKLNKAGGYTAQVYFSSDLIDQRRVFGNSIIEKGTDCGGSIEVYSSVEDAEKRNSYLSSFDGTLIASGSHTVIGTVLVRTSNELTASQQKEMEANIIAALTTVGDIVTVTGEQSSISVSVIKLINSIKKNGDVKDGDKYVELELKEDGQLTSIITYHPSSGTLTFESTHYTDETFALVKLDYDIFSQTADHIFVTVGKGDTPYSSAKAPLNIHTYTYETTLDFGLIFSIGVVPDENVQKYFNSLTRVAISGWDMTLMFLAELELSDIGFFAI